MDVRLARISHLLRMHQRPAFGTRDMYQSEGERHKSDVYQYRRFVCTSDLHSEGERGLRQYQHCLPATCDPRERHASVGGRERYIRRISMTCIRMQRPAFGRRERPASIPTLPGTKMPCTQPLRGKIRRVPQPGPPTPKP